MEASKIAELLLPRARILDYRDIVAVRACTGTGRNFRREYAMRRAEYEEDLTKEAYRLGLVAGGLLAWFANQLLWWVITQIAKAIARRWLNGRDAETVNSSLGLQGLGKKCP